MARGKAPSIRPFCSAPPQAVGRQATRRDNDTGAYAKHAAATERHQKADPNALVGRALMCLTLGNPLRKCCIAIIQSSAFDAVVLGVIGE